MRAADEEAVASAAAAEADAAKDAPAALTAEGALRAAASEGLTLVRKADNATGLKGVTRSRRADLSKPFQALVWRNGKMQHLGRYATAEEAALAYARELGPEDSKTAAAEAEPAARAHSST